MKLSKKAFTVLSFTIGACVFVSTAFADTLLGSGYDRLKGSLKNTAAQMEKGLNNYTIEALATFKDNDQALLQISTVKKFDIEKQATEENSATQNSNGKTTSYYSYNDKKQSVWKSEKDDKYYVTEFSSEIDRSNRNSNPFNEKGAPEIEKIVDALVGNLKDYVQVEEKPDGGKAYSGSLSEAQVPAIVNAVSSFGVKQMLSDQIRMEGENVKLPEIESDIFVKKVTGTALESKAGILESVTGDIVLSGKDKGGVPHDLTLNVAVKLSDVGSTKVAAPDLNGANVEKVIETGGFSSKYVGTYKNNIIMEKNGKFVKIGERTLEITSVDGNKVAGRFYETVKPGFEADYPEKDEFQFEYQPNSKSNSMFTYTDAKGKQQNGQLHPSSNGKLYLDLNVVKVDENSYRSNDKPYYDQQFDRVFE